MNHSGSLTMTDDAKTPTIEPWRRVWRKGFGYLLSERALEVLEQALMRDDTRLIQETTVVATPTDSTQDWPVRNACAIAFCGWQGEGLRTGAEIERYFDELCRDVDMLLNEPLACCRFLTWFDETPRERMRTQLLYEVRREQQRRITNHDE
jgi:hypothetical protein